MTGRGRRGDNSAVPGIEQAGTWGWGRCSQEPEEEVGKQGLCQFCGFRARAERKSPSVPSCLPPCCVESASLGYANSEVIQPGKRI